VAPDRAVAAKQAADIPRPHAMERQAARLAAEWTSSGSFPTPRAHGAAQALSPQVRSFAEARLGVDLGPVRLHHDDAAAGLTRSAHASAMTVRDDVYFARGAWEPRSETSRRLLAHELVHVAQQRLSGIIAAQLATAPATPKDVKEKYIGIWISDYAGLAADLIGRLPADSKFVNDVLDLLSATDRSRTADHVAASVTPSQVTTIATDPSGKAALWRVYASMRKDLYSGKDFDKDTEKLLFVLSPEHKHLKEEAWTTSTAVTGALKSSGATIQSIGSGWASGSPQYDYYAVTMESMPPGLTPQTYLTEMSNDLNKAVNDTTFDSINEFKRMAMGGSPAVGDVYSIDIEGPDNGSVMLVERATDHFIFQTVTTAKDGTHPEYGSREFGFEHNSDGSITFYTRGASRPSRMPGSVLIGRPAQKKGWTSLVTGIGAELVKRGGKMRAGSITSWRSLDRT
jgi:hypothetical protein